MAKFSIIVSDCPWAANDELKMSKTKRGASSQYSVLDIEAIKALKVKDISEDNALLALWVPSWLLQEGLDVMKAWGFTQKQTHIWVKTKKSPLQSLAKSFVKNIKLFSSSSDKKFLIQLFDDFDMSNVLSCYLGRLFRQTHEICLIGTRGSVYKQLRNKSQRSVHFGYNLKHSAKPENLQDMLDIMFPEAKKIELFARRSRAGWVTRGNECPDSLTQDIRESIEELILQ